MDIKVKDHDDVVRDSSTGVILNIDEEELQRYRKRKADLLREQDREREFQALKNEVKDMRAMLVEIYQAMVNK